VLVGFWSHPVPGVGDNRAWIFLALAIIPAGFAAFGVHRARGRLTVERVVAVAVIFVVALLGLTRLPAALKTRNTEYRSNAGTSYPEVEGQIAASVGMDPTFLAFLDRRIPRGESFHVVTGPSVHTAGPQAWAQYVLMPRVEQYFSPCAAQWIVLVHSPSRIVGVKLGPPFLKYSPGFTLARNAGQCT